LKAEVVLKDVSEKENGAKTQLAQKYSLTQPRAKLQNKRL